MFALVVVGDVANSICSNTRGDIQYTHSCVLSASVVCVREQWTAALVVSGGHCQQRTGLHAWSRDHYTSALGSLHLHRRQLMSTASDDNFLSSM